MGCPKVLALVQCGDPSLAGGKAAGLARLLASGLAVPVGCCVTVPAYSAALEAAGFSAAERWRQALRNQGDKRQRQLSDSREMIRRMNVTELVREASESLHRQNTPLDRHWTVRSSATNEDTAKASYAGLYRTELGLSWEQIGKAITAVWASAWNERVMDYMVKSGAAEPPPAMAVVIQAMLNTEVAGIGYSIDPVTGDNTHVTINAIRGLGRPLVEGTVVPDQYTVGTGTNQTTPLIRSILGHQHERLFLSTRGLATEPVPVRERTHPTLSQKQLVEVAALVKRIEAVFGGPVDVEWAFDRERLWALQARPVTRIPPISELTSDESEWSRANFKETMPEIPSPMGLSFLQYFMDAYILSHYQRLGCRIPSHLSSVRVLCGRPYLNLSLFHTLVAQLRGDASLLVEQMGGEPLKSPPVVRPLGMPALLRAVWLMWEELRRVLRDGPAWFAEMKTLAQRYSPDRVKHLSLEEAEACLDELGRWLAPREVTFGILGGVGQCLQALSRLLPGWLGEEWRSLLNAALQGQGNVISAQQIMRVAELVELARTETAVSDVLSRGAWKPGSYRQSFQGSRFLSAFDGYLEDYGHRGLRESDIMSPRMLDQPETLLGVIAIQLKGAAMKPAVIGERQRAVRKEALATIKARCSYRLDRWVVFLWWYRRLCRFFALREANRHHLMWYSAAARNLLLHVGQLLTDRGLFRTREDIFFLTLEEREALSSESARDWSAVVEARRAEREHWMTLEVPDTIRSLEAQQPGDDDYVNTNGLLSGIPVSTGLASGPVTFVRSEADWGSVRRGDIIVAPVIDPGMAPLFGIAAGLIVEMGGTLSHGAIIAREYGLPTVINVRRAMTLLCNGDIVIVDARKGLVKRERTSGS